MSLRSSAPPLLHALRTRYPGNTAPYLNQARATYPGGVSELDAALHLLHPRTRTWRWAKSRCSWPQAMHPNPNPAAGPSKTCPRPSAEPGVPTIGGRSSGKSALAPPCSSSSSRPTGTRNGSSGHPHPRLWGSSCTPPPPPGARGAGRGTHLPANKGGHRRYGGPRSAAPPGTTRRPPGAQGPKPRPRLGAVARRVGRVAPPPPLPMPMDGRRPPPLRG